MRVTSSGAAGHVDADLHAAGGKSGGKKHLTSLASATIMADRLMQTFP